MSVIEQAGIDWNDIENFVGFGNARAQVLFLGMEEGLSPGADLDGELGERSRYAQFEDLLGAPGDLGNCGRFFGPTPRCQRTWRPMCHLMLRRETDATLGHAKRVRYQADRLGRLDGESLLAELLPYPNPNTGSWLYETYDRPSRNDLVEQRIALLKASLHFNALTIAVGYGVGNWPHYRRVFPATSWTQHGSFEVADYRNARYVLSPHFSTRAFNTEAQLDAFADLCLARA